METLPFDDSVSRVAAAIAEPARTRMLCALMDGHARTSTELAALAEVSASTASAHLARLRDAGLVHLHVQGRHRYYRLAGRPVAQALEALMVIGQQPAPRFQPSTPGRLQYARTCYDHMAGTLAVALHDHFLAHGWLLAAEDTADYRLSEAGERAFGRLGLPLDALRARRRRFACPCLDWSARRPHLAGALGAALLDMALKHGWLTQDLDSRALALRPAGRKALGQRFGVALPAPPPLPSMGSQPAARRSARPEKQPRPSDPDPGQASS
ncbi:ArsR/SmtB family transcription factor [Pseudomonas mangiferae]|uniref:Helix-turn-helix transcriptional regulator n=1 Tax=Pseudomonas mangiferae TaxID=2593654 RepID=A0A553H4T9_9PSED|nr:helix-turn-helix transcriptional regulator [Pseudomonas mangiferae]TRX76736.1 helix-turn-helix transcriptional regulator [Pseudomonas mangiferae]